MENRILCVGELLIDFICSDVNVGLEQGVNFVKKAGGAPANVAVTISKLGGKALYAGKVGNDSFGEFLKNMLDENGVDTSMLVKDKEAKTTLAFVSLKSNGERDFIFNRGADELHSYDELNEDEIEKCNIVHLGSATALLGGTSKETYIKVMNFAKDREKFISFDPNYRSDLWKGRIQNFIEISKEFIKAADFVKVSDEELSIISGEEDLNNGLEVLHKLGAKAIAVTLGKEGTLLSNRITSKIVQSINIKSIDSTGAGDAFVGAVLYKLCEFENPKEILNDFEKLETITNFANKVGAIVCTKLGAIAAIPTLEEVNNYIS